MYHVYIGSIMYVDENTPRRVSEKLRYPSHGIPHSASERDLKNKISTLEKPCTIDLVHLYT